MTKAIRVLCDGCGLDVWTDLELGFMLGSAHRRGNHIDPRSWPDFEEENMENMNRDEMEGKIAKQEKRERIVRALMVIIGVSFLILSLSMDGLFLPGCGLIVAGIAFPSIAELFGV
jgi:hypothetical protein